MNQEQFSLIKAWMHAVAAAHVIAYKVETRVQGFDHAVLAKAKKIEAETEAAVSKAFGHDHDSAA